MLPWVLLGAAVLGKIIYDEMNKPSSSSSPPRQSPSPQPSPGPSRDEREEKRRKEEEICRDARDTATVFIRAHNDYLRLKNRGSMGNISCDNLARIKRAYKPFLESYYAMPGRTRIDHASAACLIESLNMFASTYDDDLVITPGEARREALERLEFLNKARAQLKVDSGPNVPATLQEYANDDATPAEARELVSLWRRLNENAAVAEAAAPRVVVCGRVKMGKSSLLNMLTGDFSDDPYFGVDVVPKTSEEKTRERDGLIYVDTPGLDADIEDEEKAWQSFLKADCLIFVHSLKGGELVQQELDFLGRLREKRRPTAENMLVALTWAEGCDEEKLNGLQRRIGGQLVDLGLRPWMTTVSNTRYTKGMRENKPRLAEISGLPALQSHINSLRGLLAAGAPQNRAAEINELKEKIGALLEADLNRAAQRLESFTISDEIAYAAMLGEYETICTYWKKTVEAYEARY